MEDLNKQQEEQLIIVAKETKEGFALLYDQYFYMIFNYILKRTGDLELTKDLTSETFLRVMEYLPRYKITAAPFSSWLYRIATNQMNQSFRQKKNRLYDVFSKKIEPISIQNADSDMRLWDEEKQKKIKFTLMMEYVKKLKLIDQSIIMLRYFENRKFSEIGEILDIKEGSVKVRMNRALSKLSRWMKGGIN